jgi:hypothetical protein
MTEQRGLLSSGLARVMRNKRYIVWFWLLNLTLAEFGTAAFRRGAHAVLDHSIGGDLLVHGFDLGTWIGLLMRPEFGQFKAMSMPAYYFAFVFFLATALFLPGVFLGYSSNYRLRRDSFFRACGENLWRFIRLMFIAGIVMGIFTGVLVAANSAIAKKAEESTNELLPFTLQMIGLAIIFLIMTTLRIWFDLAETDVVLSDQRAVRKSIWAALKHTLSSLPRLLGTYVVITIVAAIILCGGLWIWMKAVAPESIIGAFLVAQLTLLLLLIPRFWQRGVAVSYWQQKMLLPMPALQMVEPVPVVAVSVTPVAEPAPVVSGSAIQPEPH